MLWVFCPRRPPPAAAPAAFFLELELSRQTRLGMQAAFFVPWEKLKMLIKAGTGGQCLRPKKFKKQPTGKYYHSSSLIKNFKKPLNSLATPTNTYRYTYR